MLGEADIVSNEEGYVVRVHREKDGIQDNDSLNYRITCFFVDPASKISISFEVHRAMNFIGDMTNSTS